MSEVFSIILAPLLEGLRWFQQLFGIAGALPIYIAMFFIGVVLRLIVRPFIGSAWRDEMREIRRADRRKEDTQ